MIANQGALPCVVQGSDYGSLSMSLKESGHVVPLQSGDFDLFLCRPQK